VLTLLKYSPSHSSVLKKTSGLPLSKPNATLELLLHVNATNPVSLHECHHRLSLAQQFFLFVPNKGDQGSCGDDDDDGDLRSLFHITSGNKLMA